jgi:hypothetical protein
MQASATQVDDMGLVAGNLCSFRLFGGLIGLLMSSIVFNNAMYHVRRLANIQIKAIPNHAATYQMGLLL